MVAPLQVPGSTGSPVNARKGSCASLPLVKEHPRVVIIDGTNSLYRAFFAIPKLRAADGTPTNAAYGFVTMLGKVIREEAPDYLLVVFDARGKNFRHDLFAGYKATRDAQPEDLSAQLLYPDATALDGLVPGCRSDD